MDVVVAMDGIFCICTRRAILHGHLLGRPGALAQGSINHMAFKFAERCWQVLEELDLLTP
jgi:hypothetical protein